MHRCRQHPNGKSRPHAWDTTRMGGESQAHLACTGEAAPGPHVQELGRGLHTTAAQVPRNCRVPDTSVAVGRRWNSGKPAGTTTSSPRVAPRNRVDTRRPTSGTTATGTGTSPGSRRTTSSPVAASPPNWCETQSLRGLPAGTVSGQASRRSGLRPPRSDTCLRLGSATFRIAPPSASLRSSRPGR